MATLRHFIKKTFFSGKTKAILSKTNSSYCYYSFSELLQKVRLIYFSSLNVYFDPLSSYIICKSYHFGGNILFITATEIIRTR
jgi:hypothetical protein